MIKEMHLYTFGRERDMADHVSICFTFNLL